MKAVRLKANHRGAPVGIDDKTVRLTWNADGGVTQTAYEIETEKWRSGKVASSDMHAVYPLPLSDREIVEWRIRLWDEDDNPGEWSGSRFEMGLSAEKWGASWITTGQKAGKERIPADYFRREFIAEKRVRRARLYATACGAYSVRLNGHRLPGVLTPGTTEYPKRLYYQTYDVTELIERENVLDFTLTDGWYMGKLGFLNQHNRFGNMRKLLCRLELFYMDGTKAAVVSDGRFRCSWDGPVRFADLKDGEDFDARLTPSYSANAAVTSQPVVPTASPLAPISEHEVFPASLIVTPSGKKVLDFGQNMAGYVRFTDRLKAGQELRLQLGETLDHGEFSRATLMQDGSSAIRQEIRYISDGKGGVFQPEGFYSGFRYALAECGGEIDPADFDAVAVYSDLEFTGSFSCSNEKLNKFHENTLWSLRSNFVDIPTDCPQREKSGWDGDAQVFLPTASFMTDTAAFFRKWLRDLRDCQRKDGRVANVSPSAHPYQDKEPLSGAVGWADAAVIIPYTLWKIYGDESFITENLDLMRGWKSYVRKAAADKTLKRIAFAPPANRLLRPFYVPDDPLEKYVIESGMHWGEWLEPDYSGIGAQIIPKPELTSAYTCYSMSLLAEMLDRVGDRAGAVECRSFALGAKAAYNRFFVRGGHVIAPRQAPMVRALALGLLDEKDAVSVAADLNADVIRREYTVGTGFLSTPYVLGVLVKYGYVDTAYRLLENTRAPGWLAMVEGGATTVWENYVMFDGDGHPRESSMNHYSPGAVCAFLYDTVCGIRVTGERTFELAPLPGGTLTSAGASWLSPYGLVKSS